ncbi:major facilitator superfamily domain-containing protein [Venturia nashicola]|nr:major facilitator superfamily domain-containing protein [Venturia nashicola]
MEVPGTVLLYPQYASKVTTALEEQQGIDRSDEKRTPDGIVLSPQPEETLNDPLNFPMWRRNAALMALGLYCMVGGGMAPILATGFPNVAETFHVKVPEVALTTGLYMMGLGIGSVFLMPTAIIWGKRPVYLITTICFIGTSVWCATSPSYKSLLVARIAQGVAISTVECLASSTVSELFFLHERAFRLGIYTLLLLSGKNLFPLMGAEIIQALNWRAVFWVIAAIAAFCLILLAFFLPETFWDRTFVPSAKQDVVSLKDDPATTITRETEIQDTTQITRKTSYQEHATGSPLTASATIVPTSLDASLPPQRTHTFDLTGPVSPEEYSRLPEIPADAGKSRSVNHDHKYSGTTSPSKSSPPPPQVKSSYTEYWRHQPPKSFIKSLTIFPGRLSSTPYHLIMIRPFILLAYPSIAWASLTYACSVGWLIVLSESISALYRNRETYNFTAFESGLVYIAAFIGGVFGTAVAGKLSDIAVKFMAKRNGGVYEPEFRLVMIVPVAISSVAGLMGFGWSIEVKDMYMVPTVFFGLISFGCSLGSTVAISFAVDCYREFAGEALVTLNFSKNILHGLVWSLFFPEWLEHKGSKKVFVAIGMIQLACLLFTIPMFIYGKRARMWVAKKDMMRNFR